MDQQFTKIINGKNKLDKEAVSGPVHRTIVDFHQTEQQHIAVKKQYTSNHDK